MDGFNDSQVGQRIPCLTDHSTENVENSSLRQNSYE